MAFDYRKPRRFTVFTALGMLFWGALVLLTMPLWIVPAWLAFRSNAD